MDNKILISLVAAAAFVAGVVVTRLTSTPAKVAQAPDTVARPSQGNVMTEELVKADAQGGGGPVVHPELRKELPWQRMALPSYGTKTTLNFNITTMPVCYGADIDAMEIDQRKAEEKNLLLSVESLDGTDAPIAPMTRTLSMDELKNGFKTRFELPFAKRAAQIGVFICRDAMQEGRCSRKPPAAIGRIIAGAREPAAQGKEKDEDLVADKTYFFQYLAIDNEGQVGAFTNVPIPIQGLQSLGTRFSKWFPADRVQTEIDNLDRVSAIDKELRSAPMRLAKGDLIVVLPKRDSKLKCGGAPTERGDDPTSAVPQ